jgi:hypothetical protein
VLEEEVPPLLAGRLEDPRNRCVSQRTSL